MQRETPPSTAPEEQDRSAGIEDGLLLCFSHLRWDFVYQRPQHLLARAARTHRVVFFEEPVIGAPAPRLQLSARPEGVTVATPVLPAGVDEVGWYALQRPLLDGLLADLPEGPRTLWYYTPMALAFSDHLASDLCVYDNMDELSAFRFAPPELLARERRLLARADLVFTGGRSLYEAKRDKHASVHAFPSSIDAAHFGRARAAPGEPADQAAVPRPRIGFFGVIDERLDLGLVAAVADRRRDWQFVMIGPTAKIDEAELPRRPNVHWLGPKPYVDLPAYLAGWDAGFMPFAINDATRFISPTKTPEFLAAGVPVVSTPITDVVRPYGQQRLVAIATTAEDFVARLGAALAEPRTAWLGAVDAHLATMSWDRTWAAMLELMRDARKARTVPVPAAVRSEAAAHV